MGTVSRIELRIIIGSSLNEVPHIIPGPHIYMESGEDVQSVTILHWHQPGGRGVQLLRRIISWLIALGTSS